MSTENVRHPAPYTPQFIPIFAELLEGYPHVLDPFAGTGRLIRIRNYGYTGTIYLNELEPEWARLGVAPGTVVSCCDAENLPYPDDFFVAACTSITYGNRMADHHNARDNSKRNTYKHALGRDLTPGNTGMMPWGPKYRAKHEACYLELRRVLRNGARFILNVSDHIRGGKVVPVTAWHIETLVGLGFEVEEHRMIETPRNRQGANRHLRVEYENIIVFRLRKG